MIYWIFISLFTSNLKTAGMMLSYCSISYELKNTIGLGVHAGFRFTMLVLMSFSWTILHVQYNFPTLEQFILAAFCLFTSV